MYFFFAFFAFFAFPEYRRNPVRKRLKTQRSNYKLMKSGKQCLKTTIHGRRQRKYRADFGNFPQGKRKRFREMSRSHGKAPFPGIPIFHFSRICVTLNHNYAC